MNIAILIFMLAQSDAVRFLELQEEGKRQEIQRLEQQQKQVALLKKKEFEKRFNTLVSAVESFAKDYNQNRGQTYNAKRAAELRKAMQEFEKVAPAPRPE